MAKDAYAPGEVIDMAVHLQGSFHLEDISLGLRGERKGYVAQREGLYSQLCLLLLLQIN